VDLPAPGIPVKHTINFANIHQKKGLSMKLPEIIITILLKML